MSTQTVRATAGIILVAVLLAVPPASADLTEDDHAAIRQAIAAALEEYRGLTQGEYDAQFAGLRNVTGQAAANQSEQAAAVSANVAAMEAEIPRLIADELRSALGSAYWLRFDEHATTASTTAKENLATKTDAKTLHDQQWFTILGIAALGAYAGFRDYRRWRSTPHPTEPAPDPVAIQTPDATDSLTDAATAFLTPVPEAKPLTVDEVATNWRSGATSTQTTLRLLADLGVAPDDADRLLRGTPEESS